MNNDIYGFGYYRDSKGILYRKKNEFGVKIGKDVDIGEFTRIDAGSYRDTIIGDNTKIDSNVKIAHNCIIGSNCLIVAGSVLGGSSELGDFSYVGMGALVLDHVKVGKHCLIAAGAVVSDNVPDNVCVKGIPARRFHPNMDDVDLHHMIGIKKNDLNWMYYDCDKQ